ncbi:MAG: molybdenum cofactor guanylyltransferase [Desulfovermiculus sp.]
MLSCVSGAILCGGLNTRMHGQVKSHLRLGDQTFLQRLTTTLESVCAEVCLITRNPEEFSASPLPKHTDIFPLRSSLSGLHAALSYSRHTHVFITACDTPLLAPTVIHLLMARGSLSDDVIVPVINGYYEPLCAIYSRRCLPVMAELLQKGLAKISAMFSRVQVRTVPQEDLRTADPGLHSFINVNTPEDLARLLKKARLDPEVASLTQI